MIWAVPLIGLFVNWFIRGGGWKSAIYHNNPPFKVPGDYINAALFGLCAGIICHSWLMGISATVGMFAGSSFGWGKYIAAMKGESGKSKTWGFSMMTLRGVIWADLIALSAYIGQAGHLSPALWLYASLTFSAGLCMGIVYMVCIIWYENHRSTLIFNHWTVSEMIFGALLWSPLMVLTVR